MIKGVLLSFLAAIIVTFVGIWIWTGGIGRASFAAQNIGGFFFGASSSLSTFQLPWQPAFPTIDSPEAQSDGAGGPVYAADKSSTPAYNASGSQTSDAKTFGTQSPRRGSVSFSDSYGARESEPRAEHVQIIASSQNTAPVSIAGWSLQSAVTGIRIPIPPAASVFLMGALNDYASVALAPGATAVITSGASPVGISFRENLCSGYLGQLQYYAPPISSACPSAAALLPLTEENLRAYGEKCFDFLQYVPMCNAPLDSIPRDVSANCRAFAMNNLSYNGCVQANRWKSDFAGNSWRIFLGSQTELWGNSHDIIRLLDEEGRTIDVVSY